MDWSEITAPEAHEMAAMAEAAIAAILDEWRARGDVTPPELAAHVCVHERAHHFGRSDDDIARIDRWWE